MLIDITGCGLDSYAFRDLLTRQRVAAAPGATFGSVSEACIRISLAAAEKDLVEGVKRVCEHILKLRAGTQAHRSSGR